MEYRKFGNTGISMPVISCGGMRYQHSWNDVPPQDIPKANQENLEKTIFRAFELGINHIETARGYGSSEMQLGFVLPRLPREKLTVQTKITPRQDPAEFRTTFNQSMDYLKTGYVDLLSIHGINTPELLELTLRKGGCMDVARQLQKEGRARFIGFSTHGPLDVILQAINSGEFAYVNLHWYFFFQHNWPAIEAASKLHMGIFIISPNDKGGKLYEPPPTLSHLCQPLTPMIFNDLFCLARPQVHTLSLGPSKPSDFDEHIRMLEYLPRAEELSSPIATKILHRIQEKLGSTWWDDFHLDLPDWQETPGQIHIREILRLWSLAQALDMVEYGKMRYNLLGNGGHWFPGLQAKDLETIDLSKAISQSKYKDKIPTILAEAHQMLQGEEKKRLSSTD